MPAWIDEVREVLQHQCMEVGRTLSTSGQRMEINFDLPRDVFAREHPAGAAEHFDLRFLDVELH